MRARGHHLEPETVTTATHACDFSARYNTTFHDDRDAAFAHYAAAIDEMHRSAVAVIRVDCSESLTDIARAYQLEGSFAVTIGRSLNGRYYVGLENLDARAR
jgi:hypothetical protein